MPELPEVETIKLGLQKKIIGLKIKQIDLLSPKSFFGDPKEIAGREVTGIFRRAKVLGIVLDNELTLLFHLKMSGQIIWVGESKFIGGHPTPDMQGMIPNSHTRVVFELERQEARYAKQEKSYLYFNDQRRFGWVKIVKSDELRAQNYGYAGEVGPEPLEKEFTWEILKQNLSKHLKTPVKVAILDQKVVAGVGNIYASEACFNAKIDPRTKVKDLSDEQLKKLQKGIVKSLQDGIKYGGATRSHFVDSDGRKGYFLDYAFVYGRDKHPCKVCGMQIKKITLGGRGTFFCPVCQK